MPRFYPGIGVLGKAITGLNKWMDGKGYTSYSSEKV